MEDPAKLPPVDKPLVEGSPEVGQGDEPITTANAPESQAKGWWEELGFADEATAVGSYQHLRTKLSDQGREINELKRAQPQVEVPAGQPEPKLVDITPEQFYENPSAALAQATEASARKVLSEFMRQQNTDRMIEEAARKEGVERWELEDTYSAMQNDPKRSLEILAAVTKMQRAGVQTEAIEQAVRESAENKARATQVTSTSHVPEETEPDWSSMEWPEMMAEMTRRGMVIPDTGG